MCYLYSNNAFICEHALKNSPLCKTETHEKMYKKKMQSVSVMCQVILILENLELDGISLARFLK